MTEKVQGIGRKFEELRTAKALRISNCGPAANGLTKAQENGPTK
jgi:hypothetical protein